MTLSSGTRLGPYEILAPHDAGGMGEVYRARDTRLDRVVAIKILPSQFSADAVYKQRFEREAKVISRLNHPHICVLHDIGQQDGIDYLVMEFVEGETLAKRLEKGPLPLEQVLKIGAQIAEALDKAHRNGVAHRDLKPGNIMLTASGAKLLDFGLAKPVAPLANVATMTATMPDSPVTEKGTIVGTFQYMSPEQLEGKELDGRSDIFSLGAVLYEMLTGKRAFEGKSRLSIASAILEKEPAPISSIKPVTPPALEHAIRRCLAKDPEERWQSARDLALELEWTAESGTQTGIPTPAGIQKKGRLWLAWSMAALLGVVAVLTAVFYRGTRPSATLPVVRFEIPLPAAGLFALSPNGRHLAFMAPGADGRNLLWIRPLDALEPPRPLSGTENVSGAAVFWSPDNRFIAFQAGTKLRKIDIFGRPPQDICDTSEFMLGGAWNRDDMVIFGTDGDGIMQVPASGGVPTFITTRAGRNEVHAFPSFLPDGRHFIYLLRATEDPGIYVGSVDAKPEQQSSKRMVATPLMAGYAPSVDGAIGQLLFMRESSLLAQPLDERRLEPIGEPIPIAKQVGSYLLSAFFSASATGVLAYRAAYFVSRLSWLDRNGKEISNVGGTGPYTYLDLTLSPDGTWLATTRVNHNIAGSGQGIWLLDLVRDMGTPLTFDPAPDSAPVWSPDGGRVAFAAMRAGGMGIYQKAANGGGIEQELIGTTPDQKYPNDWSGDGRFLLYTKQDARTKDDLWIITLASDGASSGSAKPFANSDFNERQGQFSPDNRSIAYASDVSGRSEIYVQPFPSPPGGGGKTTISRDGGNHPRWRRDGQELFYLSTDGKLMAVDVSQGPVFKAGVPRSLFQVPGVHARGNTFNFFRWDVAPDGKRFLISTNTPSSDPITIVLNWNAELEK
jgi:eukaryotic-like serine/threonine-protein kinase